MSLAQNPPPTMRLVDTQPAYTPRPMTREIMDEDNEPGANLRALLVARAPVESAPMAVESPGPVPGSEPLRASDFLAIQNELDRRRREWTKMVRVLETQSRNFASAERERDRAYGKLANVVPSVQQSADELSAAIKACTSGYAVDNLEALFAKSGAALEELEMVAVELSGLLVGCRAAFDQYARSVSVAQRLRAEGSRTAD